MIVCADANVALATARSVDVNIVAAGLLCELGIGDRS